MYSVDDILALLEKGENPEVIAQKFADNLNAAIDQKKKRESREQEKLDSLQCIIDDLLDWVDIYYPELPGAEMSIKARDVIDIFDEANSTAASLKKAIVGNKGKIADAERTIQEFLRRNKL